MQSEKTKGFTLCTGLMALLWCAPGAQAATLNITKPEAGADTAIEIYGAARMSIDYMDSGVDADQAKASPLLSDGDVNVSSNTTIIGFRGHHDLSEQYTALWQYEQQVNLDERDKKDTWATADSYLGLETPYGTVKLGHMNTPFKDLGIDYMAYFNTTVGDPHVILGAQSRPAGRADLRVGNSITWEKDFDGLQVAMQYTADAGGSPGSVDDNDKDGYSASLKWDPKPLEAGVAYSHFSNKYGIKNLEAYRGFMRYWAGPLVVGLVYEEMDADNAPRVSRPAYGAQVYLFFSKATVAGVQWHHADESDAGNDAANQYSVGLFHYINKQLLLHAVYSTTRNDKNASFRGVGYAHNDYLGTVPGGDTRAFSVGAALRF